MGAEEGQGHQVTGRLGRGVRRARRQRLVLDPRTFFDRAVHLVGGDVQESSDPMAAGGFEEDLSPEDIGGHERHGTVDRPVDVRFRSEVNHHVMIGHEVLDQTYVSDVPLDEGQLAIGGDWTQVVAVPRICERIQHGQLGVFETGIATAQEAADEMGADETGATGN